MSAAAAPRTNTQRLLALFAAVSMLVSLIVIYATPADATNDHQVTVCHATGSETNPYVATHPAKHQAAGPTEPNGHGNHVDDIIPPFEAGRQGAHSWDAYGGKNWDADGIAIWNNDCEVEESEPEPELATASVDGACVDEIFKVQISVTNATVHIDLDGNGSLESGLTTGEHPVTADVGESIAWEASADDGAAFDGDAPKGDLTVLDCTTEPEPGPDPTPADVSHELDCEIRWNGQSFELFGVVDFNVTPGSVEEIDIFRAGALVETWEPGDDPIWLEAWSYDYEVTYEPGFEGPQSGVFEMDRAWFDKCSCPSGTVDLSNTGVLRQPGRTSGAGEPASPVNIAEGMYHIYLSSFDDHSTKVSQRQTQEMWALANASLSGPPTWVSPKTGDLPESVNFMSYHVTAGGAVHVPAFDNQTLWTVHQGSAASPNSVEPVCAKLVPVDSQPPPRGEIEVTKTASATVVDSGDAVTFTILVENTSNVDVSIHLIEDDVYGEIAPTKSGSVSSTSCTVPQALAPAGDAGDSYSCVFTAIVSGDAGSDHTNTVTVSGEDEHENPVSDSDSATVSIAAPVEVGSIEVTKSAGVDSVTAPAEVTFTIEVQNTSGVAVTIQEIEDDIYGEIAPSPSSAVVSTTCSVPQSLAADDGTDGSGDDFYSCQFVGVVDGEADAVHTNEVEVSGVDAGGTRVSDTASASVIINEVKGIFIPETPVTPVDIPDIVSDTEVGAEELPFTGIETDRLLGLGIMLLGGGVLLLRWVPKEEDS